MLYLLSDGTVLIVGSEIIMKYYPDIKKIETVYNIVPPAEKSILMKDGRVLLFDSDNNVRILELETKFIKEVSKKLNIPRREFLLTNLQDGKVLIVGGFDGENTITKKAELFDPINETFEIVGETNYEYPYPLNEPIAGIPLTSSISSLKSGNILITGISGCEIYDPLLRSFSSVGFLGAATEGYQKVLTKSGVVFVVGGADILMDVSSKSNILMYVE